MPGMIWNGQRPRTPCIRHIQSEWGIIILHQDIKNLPFPGGKYNIRDVVKNLPGKAQQKFMPRSKEKQENTSMALEIIGNSKINYNPSSNSSAPGDTVDSPLIDVFQPKMWLLPSKIYFRQTQVLGSIKKVTGPRYWGSQTGWSVLASINLQNPSTGTCPGMWEIQKLRPKCWVSHAHLCLCLLSLLPAGRKEWELQPSTKWGQFG